MLDDYEGRPSAAGIDATFSAGGGVIQISVS
jgi:hypothetical protein